MLFYLYLAMALEPSSWLEFRLFWVIILITVELYRKFTFENDLAISFNSTFMSHLIVLSFAVVCLFAG